MARVVDAMSGGDGGYCAPPGAGTPFERDPDRPVLVRGYRPSPGRSDRFVSTPFDHIHDLAYGHWRSQTIHAGVALDVFDHVAPGESKSAGALAAELGVDVALLYRLLRALASLDLLTEDRGGNFALTPAGELLRADHAHSLKDRVLLGACPEHYVIWRHLPDMIREGTSNAFVREYGVPAFEYTRRNTRYARIFNEGMSNYSRLQSDWVREALRDYDFSSARMVCDVGGGHGYLACLLLREHPHLSGIVLDRPEVVDEADRLWAPRLGLAERCAYVGGDMFEAVPPADVYTLKLILHDWNDDESVRILSNIRAASREIARVLIIEHIVPGPETPHIAKLFDLHMMCWGTGRERTEEEYAALLDAAGWTFTGARYPSNRLIGVVEGHRAARPTQIGPD